MSTIEKAVERLADGAAAAGTADDAPSDLETVSADSTTGRVALDIGRLNAQGFLTPDGRNERLVEEYRLIKRPILHNAFAEGGAGRAPSNLLMVTSALPGEGKTFTALNLALSMALERDYTVLLVDADVVFPNLSDLLGAAGERGLVDRHADPDVDLGSLIRTTDINKLRVLPAGKPHAHSTELLASAEMERVAAELSERYSDRMVIFDSPPLLSASQANVLSQRVGQVLLVVEAFRTPRYVVADAVSYLDAEKPVGVVLNKGRVASANYYGYGSYPNSTARP